MSGERLVRVAVAEHEPEADLMVELLRDAGIPAMAVRTSGFDVPDFLAAGRRDIRVAAERELEAREVLGTVGEGVAPRAGEATPSTRGPGLRVVALLVAICVLVGALAALIPVLS